MTRTAPGAAVVCAVLWLGVTPYARGQPAAPSPRGVRALAALSTPSYPRPLPGSAAIAPGLFLLLPNPCAGVRAAYQAPGAPIPAGARVAAPREGVLLVEAEDGSSAIFFTDRQYGCAYYIATAPTLQIEGPPGVPSGETFAHVSCMGSGKERVILASGDVAGGPHVLYLRDVDEEPLGDDARDTTAAPDKPGAEPAPRMVGRIVPGTMAQLRAPDEAKTLPPSWPAVVSELPGNLLGITFASDAGPVRVRVDCNAGVEAIFRGLGTPR